jgi:hypothetical protein
MGQLIIDDLFFFEACLPQECNFQGGKRLSSGPSTSFTTSFDTDSTSNFTTYVSVSKLNYSASADVVGAAGGAAAGAASGSVKGYSNTATFSGVFIYSS